MAKTAANVNPFSPINAHAGALWAVRRGLPVLPVKPNSKDPFDKDKGDDPKLCGGVNIATTDEAAVNAWFKHNPAINYGMAMGDGRVTLDCDIYKDGGHTEFLQLDYPKTLEMESARGGAHIVLNVDFDAAQKKLAESNTIDVRARGGYIVGPGSIVDGKRYKLVCDAAVAPCPPELAARIRRRGDKTATKTAASGPLCEPDRPANVAYAVEWLKTAAPAIQGANGDDRTYAVAAQMKNFGVSEPTALAILLDHWNNRCDPPWTPEELEGKIANGYAYSQRAFGHDTPDADFEDISTCPVLLEWDRRRAQGNAPAAGPGKAPAPGSGETPAVRWIDDQDLSAKIDWLVTDTIPQCSSGFLGAESGTGKTFVAVDLALAVWQGKPWFGRQIAAPGGSFMVAAEGAYGIPLRVRGAAQHKFGAVAGIPFAYQVDPPSTGDPAAFIATLKAVDATMRERYGVPLRLVMLDTFAQCFAVKDENSAAETAKATRFMAAVARALGVVVCAVHHFGKDSAAGLRGSSALKAAADFVITLPEKGELKLAKAKDAPDGMLIGRFGLTTVAMGTRDDGKPLETCIVDEGATTDTEKESTKDSVLQALFRAVYDELAGPTGKVVPHDDIQKEVYARFPVDDGETDQKKIGNRKRKAWERLMALKVPVPKLEIYDREGVKLVRKWGTTDPNDEFDILDPPA